MNFHFSEIQTHISQQLQPIRLETMYFLKEKKPQTKKKKSKDNNQPTNQTQNTNLDTKPLEIP